MTLGGWLNHYCIGRNRDSEMTLFLLLFAQLFASDKLGLNSSNRLFFFNNPNCLAKMQSWFLEVIQEPRPSPCLAKC